MHFIPAVQSGHQKEKDIFPLSAFSTFPSLCLSSAGNSHEALN